MHNNFPSLDPCYVTLGSKKKGLDGNLYRCTPDINGNPQWQLYMICGQDSCQFVQQILTKQLSGASSDSSLDQMRENSLRSYQDRSIEPELESKLQNLLPNKKIKWTIYGGDYCSYCKRAKITLDKINEKYRYIDISPFKIEIYRQLRPSIKDHHTIPMIFHYDQFIGGYSELAQFLDKE